MLRTVIICLSLCLGTPGVGQAQVQARDTAPPAVLVADDLYITSDRVLVASGNVEAFQGTTRISARAIRYDQRTGKLIIDGPITLRDGDEVVILASAAELDPGLQSGLLRGARLVLNRQLQLAAVQINRVEGRYSQLYKTAVTSCRVCDDGRPPLWQIRAKRVVHDQEARQLYFDQAQFRIGRVPVFYIPRLRLPDPTLKRATGVLIPSLRTTSQLGTGLKLPYFIKLGDHRDLTLTPYLSGKTRTLEFRYRQAFVRGDIRILGAVTRDDLRPDGVRGYVFAEGRFDLPRDFKLTFDLETVSDDAYLTTYSYSEKDRLDSELRLSRTRRDEYMRASLINYTSLRPDEVNAEQPTIIADGVYEARYFPARIGGELRLAVLAHSHYRYSDADIAGRDVNRMNVELDWLRAMTLPGGLRAEATLGGSFDLFNVSQDSSFPETHTQVSPDSAVALRYPLVRHGADGVSQMIEPVVQLGWTDNGRADIPNEESTRVEFDEGNLLSLSRFPRPDRRERGAVVAYGVNWSRFDPTGWDAHLTIGQVFRRSADTSFTTTSGLSGTTSDVLVAGQVKTGNGWALTARTTFNEGFDFSKAEVRGGWIGPRAQVSGSYLWLTEDLAEDRAKSISEITLDGAFKVNRFWTARADWRFDLADNRAATAGIGLEYVNECVTVDLSVDRRYTSSTSVEPSTNLGFTIGLRGFSARNGTESYTRSCGK
ncbi:LPS-assembly protein LptD [Sulfitobacter sabulilitoris]|uniref:LPS-assembly protein LptD n=1 Tax=Sulfitobacter sabulilitoris TaxID=2562655 RepID=A0A5S3QEL2_9RHOB|nr:LPS assembly protein LptD [Sulfitobacter sabulilitoris]TMM55612.1 LPS-assembly protein LptD [Sulfitobacter sabulilitoris]